ncbi:hypothetical protein RclHR1_26020002 [Rhizophagus clarus]|uniref:ATP-dependent DNA helicase n=1 Tax=Rhizophagus clarus TaxID=94130 RepID=A0A2Z6R006_9GLOM|nr:hypothetical protein RclHR1_26020002 [Rhizophagus clarus]
MASQCGFKTDSQHTRCIAIYFKKAIGWICDTRKNEESFEINDSGQTEKSPLKAYWDQPTKLENFMLFWLHLTHKLVKENDTIAWSTLYNCHLEKINTDLIDILGSPKDDMKSEILDKEKEDLIKDEEINAEKENIIVDYQVLNGNQKIIFKQIEFHYNDVLNGHQIDPLKIIVMGTAETGKTYLIKAIRSRLQKMVGTGLKSPIIVLAPIGIAAFNING